MTHQFPMPISEDIWDLKYRFKDHHADVIHDQTVEDTWRRVANALAEPETNQELWADTFYSAMEDWKFMPAGRIIAGAGTGRLVTLFNCLSADTPILTAQYGLVEIGTIAGEVVEVLDGNGNWIESPINSFGEQSVASVTLRGGYLGRERRVVRATAKHRWVLEGGEERTTKELVSGDSLVFVKRQNVPDTAAYRAGVAHGVVYGDGSFERNDATGKTFRVRLCGAKKELAQFFDHAVQTEPPSYDGDPLFRVVGSKRDLKALPENESVDYLTGFLRGWMATDGSVCSRDRRPSLCCDADGLDWLQQFGAVSGMEVRYASRLQDETNYGTRKKACFNVSFTRWTMIEEDFLLGSHRDNFGKAPEYPWTVESVGDYSDPEPVYCPRVVTTDSVQLHSGIHTGQCYVMGTIPDDLKAIFDNLQEAALTMQQGGGIGYDFSTLRPKGAPVKRVGADASGPLPFMDTWDAMCRTIMSAGTRRGAMMATMRCDHPDIEEFITAKQDPARLRMFNVSVLCTDAFMEAVRGDKPWDLVFDGKVYRTISALELWRKIMRSTYDYAEPGVIFIDRINDSNNLRYCEEIAATNPCLHPDSMVETVHGRVRIADIKEPTMVYTMLPDGSLGVRQASAAFISKPNAKVLSVKTRNGKNLRVTPEHKVLIHSKDTTEWVKAKDLKVGDRLVQLCRARRGMAYSGVKLTTEENRAYRMEHRMVAEAVHGPLDYGHDVHHIDGDTYNNGIDNLTIWSHGEHAAYTATFDNPQTHQIVGDDGRFISTGTTPKTVIPMPETLRSNMKNQAASRVVSVQEVEEKVDVWDLTVEETHNFVADFTVVHNCGEQPLPPYGACLLGSVNLAKLVIDPFTEDARIDSEELDKVVTAAIRMMDNVNDVSKFPLEAQRVEAQNKRRIGLGVTGLADMLVMLRVVYGSEEAKAKTSAVLGDIAHAAYETSVALAMEKGAFPYFNADEFVAEGTFASGMDPELIDKMETYGIRNSHLLSIAPTGTISMYGGNVSSGIEPIFAFEYERKVTRRDGTKTTEEVMDYAVKVWRDLHGDEPLPDYFVSAQDLPPSAHVEMQAVCQRWVDSSISKTINLPEDIDFADFEQVYMDAYDSGCKGCTTYRPNDVTGSVISVKKDKPKPVTEAELAQRPDVLDGQTYKVKMGGEPAFYITITDIMEDGQRRPFEVFINTKNPEHIAWSTALTRMISAIFRRPHDSSFVVEELKNVFDPKGGGFWKGRYRPSVVAAIGQVIEDHMKSIGYLEPGEAVAPAPEPDAETVAQAGPVCPKCYGTNFKHEGGCTSCGDCGYSSCG